MEKPKLVIKMQQGGSFAQLQQFDPKPVYTPRDFQHEAMEPAAVRALADSSRTSRGNRSDIGSSLPKYKEPKEQKDKLEDAMPSDSRYIRDEQAYLEAATTSLINKYGSEYINSPEYQTLLPRVSALANSISETKAFYQQYTSSKDQINAAKDMQAISPEAAFVIDTTTRQYDIIPVSALTETTEHGELRYDVQTVKTAATQWFEDKKFTNLAGNPKGAALKKLILDVVPSDEIDKDVDRAYKNLGTIQTSEKGKVLINGKIISSLETKNSSNNEAIQTVLSSMLSDSDGIGEVASRSKVSSYVPSIISEAHSQGKKLTNKEIWTLANNKYTSWLLNEAAKRLSSDYGVANTGGGVTNAESNANKSESDKQKKEVSSLHLALQTGPLLNLDTYTAEMVDGETKEGQMSTPYYAWKELKENLLNEEIKVREDKKDAEDFPTLAELGSLQKIRLGSLEGGAVLTGNGLDFGPNFNPLKHAVLDKDGETGVFLFPTQKNKFGNYEVSYGLTKVMGKAQEEFSKESRGYVTEEARKVAFEEWLRTKPEYSQLTENNIVLQYMARVPVIMRVPEEEEAPELVINTLLAQPKIDDSSFSSDTAAGILTAIGYTYFGDDEAVKTHLLVPLDPTFITGKKGKLNDKDFIEFENKQTYLDALQAGIDLRRKGKVEQSFITK